MTSKLTGDKANQVGEFLGHAMQHLNDHSPRDVEAVEILNKAWGKCFRDWAELRKGDKANQQTGESIERLKLRAIVRWLEANQPDVFKRGLWEAISEAETLDKPVSVKQASLSPTEECWNCGSLVWAKAEAPRKPSAEQELLNKYRMAIDAIYNSGDLGRNLVIKHFGLHHPTVEIESFGDPWGGPDSHGNEPTVREVRQHPEPAPKEQRVINGNLTHVWQDAETGMWIAEFLRMLESAETPERAIERLQNCVVNQAKMFAGEIPVPGEHPEPAKGGNNV